MQERLVLARYRPTARQALGRGLYLGTLGAVRLAALGLLMRVCHAGAVAGAGPLRWALTLVAVALLAALVGGVAGLLLYRRGGTEVDDRGVCRLRAFGAGYPSWPDVVD